MLETVKTLCSLSGVSGWEDEVRAYLIEQAKPYAAVLRVFNHKSMLLECRVPERCGLRRNDRHAMPDAVLRILAGADARAEAVRAAIRGAFAIPGGIAK